MKLCSQRVTLIHFESSVKTMAVEIYKILNGMGSEYLSALFSKSNVLYQLRDANKLTQPLKRTTTFGIKSLAYFGTHGICYII